MTDASALLARLGERGWSLAVAESLTGGLLASTIVDVPGASVSFRGGVVAYATDVKRSVLGVDGELLASRGAVDPAVAQAMAEGVRRMLRADVAIATTGVAGPDPQDGQPVGTVWIAVVTPESATAVPHRFDGDRSAIRAAAVAAALALVLERL